MKSESEINNRIEKLKNLIEDNFKHKSGKIKGSFLYTVSERASNEIEILQWVLRGE